MVCAVTMDGTMQPYALTLDKILDHAAKWHPATEVVTASITGGAARVSYAELRAQARQVSAVLAARGVRAGDRVATLAWNSSAHMAAWYAVMGMGAVCHTLNPRLTAGELAAMLGQSQARLMIVSADLLQLAQDVGRGAPGIERVMVIDGTLPATSFETAMLEPMDAAMAEAAEGVVWGGFDENFPSTLCFTSGTTGAPKGVTYTHRSSYLHTLKLLQADIFAITSKDSVLAAVPMFHGNAWGLPFAAPSVGAKLVLPGRRTDGATLARLINSEAVTMAVGVPTLWLGLVEHLESVGGEVPSLQRILVGGAPLHPALMNRIEQRLGVTIQTSWGMTELSPSGTVAPPDDPRRTASLAGRPPLGVDLLLTDADGCPLPEQRGVEGHLRVRGAAVIERYFGHDEVATDPDGWFPTGDLARIDPGGNLMITGRAKDLIKSGGEWINPAEIEAIVGALPQVSLAAVIGRPDLKWGERPLLVVEVCKGQTVSDEQMLDAMQGRVASWWIPDQVVRLPAMPMAPTGKIDKAKLRAEYGHD